MSKTCVAVELELDNELELDPELADTDELDTDTDKSRLIGVTNTRGTQMYAVNLFGSHPDEGNDDCWTGQDFSTEAEARQFYDNPFADPQFAQFYRTCTQYLQLTGPDLELVRLNPDFRPSKPDNEWRREAAMQAGMMGGTAAYNDAMEY